MASPRPVVGQSYQETFNHKRENPFFNAVLKHDDQNFTFDLPGSIGNQNISRSTSDVGRRRHEDLAFYTSEKSMESTFEESVMDTIFDPYKQTSSEKWSKVSKTTSLGFSRTRSDSSYSLGDLKDARNELGALTLHGPSRPTIEKTYSMNKRKVDLSSIPLPQSAASFYNGISPQMEVVEQCESTDKLNSYLRARKDELNSGVPGKFLHAVIGQDVSDVGSVASAIMYAFYLSEAQKMDHFCTVPVINMKREDLNAHAELKWLLDSCQIDQASLVFVDEVDLSYYDLFGSLKLVLLNGQKLPARQEALKDAVVEILTCKKGESAYPWVKIVTETEQDCSCCTVVAEKFALTSPEILVGKGFSRLLAGILLDSDNLTNPLCSSKDKYMAMLLINGAGRLGCNVRYKKHDVSDLKVIDILRKDFKRWTRVGKLETFGSRLTHVGMSSIGISVGKFLSHEDAATQEIKYFQQLEKLRLLMIVSGYYDSKNKFKREILVCAESVELMKSLLMFFNANATHLPLKVLHRPGLTEEMRAFEIDKVTSRKTIERLLEEFGGTSKGQSGM
ncbi:DHHA2 domain containing protein [Parasponia andersonii]|uniref:DHHA2 domain containing protein n=1 Tax=Parasponia andersonii TaxID=3476 RepID=A0A2P5ASK8_PARAD|nr:DHHA2 domain containing protein [Parasponia andersonii]